MQSFRVGTAGAGTVGKIRALVVVPALLMAALSGCKTQDDAVAAADQMTKTAATLSAYYAAMERVTTATKDTLQAQSALDGVAAMDPKPLDDLHAAMVARRKMAVQIAQVAGLLQDIVKSTASKDASKAAGTFNTELVTVGAIGSSDGEAKAVTEAVQLIVRLVQQHDEVAAARQVEPLTHALAQFFQSEKLNYEAMNGSYLKAAGNVATEMVETDQFEGSPVFESAMKPFHLKPALSAQTKQAIKPYLLTKIDRETKERVQASTDATEALGKALNEMDVRVSLVTHDQPMKIRLEPLSLATVRMWIADATTEAGQ